MFKMSVAYVALNIFSDPKIFAHLLVVSVSNFTVTSSVEFLLYKSIVKPAL